MHTTITTELKSDIFIITINRPEKLNALNAEVMQDLELAIDEVYSHPGVRSAIITGAGTKAFVAGADISEFVGLSAEQGKALAKSGSDLFLKIENCPKPIVAAVNGFALGGGCELAMCCHFRIAADNAMFGQPEINLGLIPGYGGTQRLVQLIGKGRALEMILTGKMIDAGTALQYGLVNAVIPQAELMEKAISILSVINSKAPIAVAKCIEAVNAVSDKNIDGYATEQSGFGYCFGTSDMKEGTTAFLEKRKPVFTGN